MKMPIRIIGNASSYIQGQEKWRVMFLIRNVTTVRLESLEQTQQPHLKAHEASQTFITHRAASFKCPDLRNVVSQVVQLQLQKAICQIMHYRAGEFLCVHPPWEITFQLCLPFL